MPGFGPSVSGGYAAVSDSPGLWNTAPSLMFDISSADEGKTIVLKVEGNPFGNPISQTKNIKIREPELKRIIVTPHLNEIPLTTTSAGREETFSVRLSKTPSRPIPICSAYGVVSTPVVINMHSTDEDNGTINFSSISLTNTTPAIVTITGHDDGGIHTEAVPYQIILDKAVSDDPKYHGQNPADVECENSYFSIAVDLQYGDCGGRSPAGGWSTHSELRTVSFPCSDYATENKDGYYGREDVVTHFQAGEGYKASDLLLEQSKVLKSTTYALLMEAFAVGNASAGVSATLKVFKNSIVIFTQDISVFAASVYLGPDQTSYASISFTITADGSVVVS